MPQLLYYEKSRCYQPILIVVSFQQKTLVSNEHGENNVKHLFSLCRLFSGPFCL